MHSVQHRFLIVAKIPAVRRSIPLFADKLCEIHDAANGWIRTRCDFDEIEILCYRLLQRIGRSHYSKLGAIRRNYPNLRGPNSMIPSDRWKRIIAATCAVLGKSVGHRVVCRTLFRQTIQWACPLGWDDRQNGQEFADRVRTGADRLRPRVSEKYSSLLCHGWREDQKKTQGALHQSSGFDDADVFLSHRTTAGASRFCGGRITIETRSAQKIPI